MPFVLPFAAAFNSALDSASYRFWILPCQPRRDGHDVTGCTCAVMYHDKGEEDLLDCGLLGLELVYLR